MVQMFITFLLKIIFIYQSRTTVIIMCMCIHRYIYKLYLLICKYTPKTVHTFINIQGYIKIQSK